MDWLDWEPILKEEAVKEIVKSPEVSNAHGLDHLEESRELAREGYEYAVGFFKKLREDLKAE